LRHKTGWLVAFLLINSAVATARPLPEARRTGADSPAVLARAIARHARSPAVGPATTLLWDSNQGATGTSHVPTCRAKTKGVIIGAAIGAVAGVAVGTYIAKAVGGVLGTGSGARRYVGYWTIGGAGAGALGGLAFCS